MYFDKMAGTRKRTTNVDVLCFLVLFCMTRPADCIHCYSQQNEHVDWFIAYKVPGSEKEVPANSFYYMDANSPVWALSPKTLDESDHAIYNTLNQIYTHQKSSRKMSRNTQELLYLMYNDEPPKSSQHQKFYGSNNGHTKGVIAFDSKHGFWLVHSTPKFPPPKSAGYSWPHTADIYGQSFLCVSMDTYKNLDEIGHQLLYNYPDIYDQNFPESFSNYTNMGNASAGKHVIEEPWYRETKLTTLAGVTFLSFAKYAYFDRDLYSDWIAPRFESTLLVETWQNGINKMCSNCTGKYKVYNVETLEFKQRGVTFKETQDHSKWAVTNTSANIWTCIGDINRQMSQVKRPGGTVCFQNKSVWQNFHDLITSYHDCGPYKECIPPQ